MILAKKTVTIFLENKAKLLKEFLTEAAVKIDLPIDNGASGFKIAVFILELKVNGGVETLHKIMFSLLL